MNRAQRRAERKATPRTQRLTPDTLRRQLARNGITLEDVKRDCDKSYKDGYSDGVKSVYTALYAGVCLAANELYGFGEKRCFNLIKRADELVLNRLTTKDLTDEVFERMGLTIDEDAPFDRIQEA